MNTNSPTRDSTPMLVQMPLSMGAPSYERSSPRDLVYDVATAKNPDGSKKYQLDIATNTLVTKVNFDTTAMATSRRPPESTTSLATACTERTPAPA